MTKGEVIASFHVAPAKLRKAGPRFSDFGLRILSRELCRCVGPYLRTEQLGRLWRPREFYLVRHAGRGIIQGRRIPVRELRGACFRLSSKRDRSVPSQNEVIWML